LIALNAALLALMGALTSLPGQSRAFGIALLPVFVILLAVSVVLAFVGDKVTKDAERVKREQERRERIDQLLLNGSAARLPRLSELADVDFGATPTRYGRGAGAPYVKRGDADKKIRDMLASPGPPYPFVMVWGTTKVGKSRTLAEALRAVFAHDQAVIVPRNGQAFAELVRLRIDDFVDRRPAVVVLDDLDPAGLATLTTEVLDRVRKWAVIAATMTAQRRAAVLETGSDVGNVAQRVLADTSEYELTSGAPTGAENIEAERLYPQEHFVGSIAETLVGAVQLIAQYRAGQDSHPAGCAIVRAAIDARRAGLARPVTNAELQRLFPLYLHAIRIDLQPTAEKFTEGIQWATKPIASQVALLRQAHSTQEEPEWMVFDHALTADDGNGEDVPRPIPSDIWALLIEVVPADETLGVGLAASARGETAAAINAFSKAATSSVPVVAAAGALSLGSVLESQKDHKRARVAFQQAIDSGHSEYAPAAALRVGLMLENQKDYKGAEVAFEQAINFGPTIHAQAAALRLGHMLAEQDNVPGARIALQRVIDSGDSKHAPGTALYLGDLLREHGDEPGAQVAYQQAINSGHPHHAVSAEFRLGNLLEKQGNVAGAAAAYQVVVDSGRPDLATPSLAFTLGNLLRQNHDLAGAEAVYRRIINSGDLTSKPDAAFYLGSVLLEQRDVAGARLAFQRVIHCGESRFASMAAYGLELTEGGSADAPSTALFLGTVLKALGDLDGARVAFQRVIDSGDAIYAPAAAQALAT
jgi:TolA-binding protein